MCPDITAYKATDILSWGRYLCWLEEIKDKYDELLEQKEPKGIGSIGLMAHYYGALYVLIEGWETIAFRDPIIEQLLSHQSGFKELLRRFRNATFHYQPELLDDRLLGLLKRKEEHVEWVVALHDEFLRFFRELIESFKGSNDQKEEFQKAIKSILGYIPLKAIDKHILEVQQLNEETAQALRDNPPTVDTSRLAFEMKQAINLTNSALSEAAANEEGLRRTRLSHLGINIEKKSQ